MSDNASFSVPQDLVSGTAVILFGAAGFYFGRAYPAGSAVDMGPGYLPRLVSLLLIGLGAVLCLRGAFARGLPVSRVPFRPLVLVLGAMLLFAATIERAGLALACTTAFLVSAFATPQVRWKEAIALAIGLSACAVAIFVYGLGQPIPIWPR